MKFKDLQTRNVLETRNVFNIEQYKKYPERYEAVAGSASPFDTMTDEQLMLYAAENNIDVSKAKTRAAILKLFENLTRANIWRLRNCPKPKITAKFRYITPT
jgi:recombinational DNA repair protein RecR